jgi:hypothetical protein
MSFISGRKISQRTAIAVIALIAPVLATCGTATAAYGPPLPPPGPPIGGYECILTSQLVPDFAARTIGPLRDGELLITLHIRAYSFAGPVQLTITEPYSRSGGCDGGPKISRRGLGGFTPIGGVGVLIGLASESYGRFLKPVTLRIKDTDLNSFEIGDVAPLYGNHVGKGGRRTHGTVTLSVDTSSDWVFLVKQLKRVHAHTTSDNSRDSRQLPAAVTVTATLLPAGRQVPGTGVLVPAGNGHALSTRGSAAFVK